MVIQSENYAPYLMSANTGAEKRKFCYNKLKEKYTTYILYISDFVTDFLVHIFIREIIREVEAIFMKKRIMIYGDSNTHGYNAENGSRFDMDTRWTGVCQKILGEDYLIVEEGLNGRNTCHDDPEAPFLNGLSYIVPCVLSQMPLDLICV